MREAVAGTVGSLVDGRFELVETIGVGGMSEVFRAIDRATGDDVAVKMLRGVDPSMHQRFAREAEALLQLDDPAIVRLRAEGVDHGRPYLVLDLVDGPSLAAVLAGGPLPEAETARIGAVVARALAHAHAAGVVHRDLKPGNILLAGGHDPMLVDFGIATLAGSTAITSIGTVIGTASYLAPEQLRGDRVGPAADVYSLGLVLIEAMSGARAFNGPPAEAAAARLVAAPAPPPEASPWFGSVLASMTALDPASRASTIAVADALEAHRPVTPGLDGELTTVIVEPTSVFPAEPVVPIAPVARRRGLRAVVVGTCIAALLAVVAFAWSSSGSLPSAPTAPTTVTTAVPSTTVPTTTAPPTTKPPPKGHGRDKTNQDG